MSPWPTNPSRIAGPVAQPKKPRALPPPGAWDAHAHVFGPADKFPYTPGRGYTPPDAPVEKFVALLDHNGCEHGLVVQGNAHGYDNRVVLDALSRFPQRLRGVAITDTRIAPETLRDWHKLGMRGLRFHLFAQEADLRARRRARRVRGVPQDHGRARLGRCRFSATGGCWRTWRRRLREIAREMPVIVDHYGMVEAARGVNEPNFQALLKLVGDGARAREGLGALPHLHAISRLCRRAARCTRRCCAPIRSG